MFRSSFFQLVFILVFITSFVHGRNRTLTRQRQISSTRKPVSIKICGLALVRMLDMICTRARQLLKKNERTASSLAKREFQVDDDPFSRTISVTDYSQFNDTLVGDCCLQACTVKTLLKYC